MGPDPEPSAEKAHDDPPLEAVRRVDAVILQKFRSMTEGLPAIDAFPQRMAQLHRSATSPDGRFGFFEPTCHGHTPIDHGWHETWEAYFASTTRRLFQWEQAAQGPNQDILDLMEPFFSNVIPRLLRPLETDGRSITPSLIHGDLWHGNVATDADTQEPVIFDAASSYAHNEYELGVWRQPWNELGAAYRARYHEFFPPSLPVEDCDDRNALYATRVNILDSILYRDDDEYRKMLIASMRRLVEKFPGGYEEWKGKQDDLLINSGYGQGWAASSSEDMPHSWICCFKYTIKSRCPWMREGGPKTLSSLETTWRIHN
ncbi:Protein-ribulosamine 3-kinase like protein [Verticillium longisporum]|uniref:Protein-ribulosamine 3-kinase like protein n=1 Tax=Verticillium longisporum TaxID=100787 RepID=A0A8I2ZA84_VERLO|nr:Protein-ribulosamine 3-kinase like protein [Verticillium longisporum]